MTRKERAIAAMHLRQPDEVPTFELEFQLEEEMFGQKFIPEELSVARLPSLSQKEKEAQIYDAAVYAVQVYDALEYAIIPAYGPGDMAMFWRDGILPEETKLYHRYLKELCGDRALLGFHGDGTYEIPDGEHMLAFAYAMSDDPQGVKDEARRRAGHAIERNKRLQDSGIDCLFLCADYCYNSGPFLSPAMFEEFIQPYLYDIIHAARQAGMLTIKHTDGNIMPILDQLAACEPHALHSLDPMAGVDIRVVKQRVGNALCLCGNVHCAAMQTGTRQEVIDSATYCLTHGKPGGGYIFCTSNVPFKGMPPERYQLVLDVWKKMRAY